YELVTINPTSAITRNITLTQNTTVQWRALESSYEQFNPSSPYQVSDVKTIVCETTTTTTLPPVKYIFEPLISTNRVCDFENGGAEFGITVDNSKSNVAAEVLKKIWINDTQIAEETVRVEAGQTVDFSSIEVGENKFFTVALEVTNTENSKVQKMIKNKDADCIDDGIQASDDLNPLDKVEESEGIDSVMDGDGDDTAFGDNGESLLFLAPDDNVTWAYNEDAEDIFTDPQENNPPPIPDRLPDTGRNVAGLVISFGLLLMAFGALVLRRAYRF
ncbi:MAG: LPXTG cell wall anchor domain-containing protein, partial [Alphaproteobacteria bacterium]|nr:LPXTG cell wall anchor domain-containing protein [Alphaproteobacteria bacterium]